MHRSLKRNLVIGGAVLTVAAGAGGAYAATQNSGPTTRQAFLNDVAKRLHVTPQQLSSALSGAFTDRLQAEVNSGRLTQAQANALEQRLKQKGTATAPVPFGFFGFGPGPRGGLRGLLRAPVPPGFGGGGVGLAGPDVLSAAASYLGLTDQQLVRQLQSGKSLAQVATSKNKTVSGLTNAMTSAAKTRLDRLVANKMITDKQEQKLLSALSARIAAEVNSKGPLFPRVLRPGLRFPKGAVPAPPNGGWPAPPKGAVPVPPNGTPVPPAYAPAPYLVPAPTA